MFAKLSLWRVCTQLPQTLYWLGRRVIRALVVHFLVKDMYQGTSSLVPVEAPAFSGVPKKRDFRFLGWIYAGERGF
jgi:hypothetical protein